MQADSDRVRFCHLCAGARKQPLPEGMEIAAVKFLSKHPDVFLTWNSFPLHTFIISCRAKNK